MAWVGQRARVRPGAAVLEIGSLDINGSIRELFADSGHYHGIDIAEGPGVDEVADAARWTPPRRYDVVVCAEVLEHAPRWDQILHTAWNAVAPRGALLMTCATDPRAPHSAIDGHAPRPEEHYKNIAAAEVQAVVENWECTDWSIEVHRDRGDLYLYALMRRGTEIGP
jgi:hypothetical protein